MGISVPELFPVRPQANTSCEHTPVTNATPPPRPTNPATLTSQSHNRPQQTNQRPKSDTPLYIPPVNGHSRDNTTTLPPTRQSPPVTHKQTEPRLVDRQGEPQPNDNYRDVPPELYTPPKPLTTKVNNIVAGHIPKQHELDKITNLIKRKIIRDYNLPIDMSKLKTEQETSPFFKPVYDFLAHDILPNDKKAAKTVKLKAEE